MPDGWLDVLVVEGDSEGVDEGARLFVDLIVSFFVDFICKGIFVDFTVGFIVPSFRKRR